MFDAIFSYFTTIIINSFTAINIVILTQLLFGVPLCKKWIHYPILTGAFLLLNIVCTFLFPTANLQSVMIYLYILVPIVVLAKGHRIRAVLSTIPAILLYTQWSTITRMFDSLFGLDQYTMVVGGVDLPPLYLMSDFLLAILLGVCLYYSYKRSVRIQLTFVETLILCAFCLFHPVVYSWLLLLEETFQDSLYSIAWVVFMLVLNFAVIYGIIHRSNARRYRKMAENYKDQFSTEYAYFKDYKKQQQTTARFRHDWNNHMLLLQGMMQDGDYEKAKAYFRNLTEQNEMPQKKILTGNEIVDIILNAKAELLQKEQIAITCNGGLEKLSFMEDVDICILFSNLVDNAIEANQKCGSERFISLQTTESSTVFMLSISNRMSGNIHKSENRLHSTKENGTDHGIGTQNAFSVIKKYQGEYDIETKENIFKIRMVFPNNIS